MKQKVIIFGSTGSIGTQTLNVIDQHQEKFDVVGLSFGGRSQKLFEQQINKWNPQVIHSQKDWNSEFGIRKYSQSDGLLQMVQETDFDICVLAIWGSQAIDVAYEVLRQGKILCIATKEVLVCEGKKIMDFAQQHGGEIRPIDSEHSAIWQCIKGEIFNPGGQSPYLQKDNDLLNKSNNLNPGVKKTISKIYLTCSGGPFRDAQKWPLEKLYNAKKEDVLNHPTWQMGAKITVDSATLMNKALELIETCVLFDVKPEQVKIVIHPQSIIHSAVEFVDGSVIAQMSSPTMEIPIANALLWPDRSQLDTGSRFPFIGHDLTFEAVDETRFPSLQFARKALQNNKCMELNNANEEAVMQFLNGEIGFGDIFKELEKI